ncbi:hypothetical protein [Curtobacterium sp. MCSS17_016]|uniref:hypothetical protein n=1 Tax=Curtobacterium sp. MCSS17_016 TaxID=2175644 RepID=UPI000DA790DF|nr:hypothetical protein [Curtobacterium sp. MCSS17_016]WIE80994.1 hypothetical protein DEJ19_020980 [Curtobacterium sp. MCSS17_016]
MTDSNFDSRLTATASVTRDHRGRPFDLAPYDRAHIRFHLEVDGSTDIGYASAVIVPNVRTHFDLREAAGGPVPTARWYSDLASSVDRKYRDIGALLTAAGILGRRDVLAIRDFALLDNFATETIIRTALHAISTSFIARNAALIIADTESWYTAAPEDSGLYWWAETDTGVIVP